MLKIIILKGLPGSGKSTWAKNLIDENPGMYKRINKDEIRAMLDNGRWSKDNEKFVLDTRDHLILAALESGKHVIVDDTNLASKHEEHIKQLTIGLTVVETKFFDVPVEECIERDLKRPHSVGAKVITQMYNQFLRKKPTAPEFNPALPGVILCDIDGTLAKMNGRGPFEWDKVDSDLPNYPVIKILQLFHPAVPAIILSGRDNICLTKTVDWLRRWSIPHVDLYMREAGDQRKDAVVKLEMFKKNIEGKYNVLFVLDDRDQVVDLWRNELGLTCFQVAEGNF